MMNRSFFARHKVYAISPQLVDDDTVTTAWIPVHNAQRLVAILRCGATDITVDAKLEQATSSGGAGAKDVTDSDITQLTASGGDDKTVGIDLEVANLDTANGFCYVRLSATAGDGTLGANLAGVVIVDDRHMPVTQPADFVEQIVLAG